MPDDSIIKWQALQTALEELSPELGDDIGEEDALLLMGEIISRTTRVFGPFLDSRYGSQIPEDAYQYQLNLRDLMRLLVFSYGFVGQAASAILEDIDALHWGKIPPRLSPKPRNTSKFELDDAAILNRAVELADFIRSQSKSTPDYHANLEVLGNLDKYISPTWIEQLRKKLAAKTGRALKYNKLQAERSFIGGRQLSEGELLDLLQKAKKELSHLHRRITKNKII